MIGVTNVRDVSREQFLQNNLAGKLNIINLPADASLRRYSRIVTDENQTYILMDCPPEHYSLEPFINIANLLRLHNLSAPEIYAENHEHGFLLLEDFGAVSVSKLLSNANSKAREIYQLTIEILANLRTVKAPNTLAIYSNNLLIQELELFLEWYVPHVLGTRLKAEVEAEYFKIWQDIFNQLPNLPSCLVLRDYHVDNMMHLPMRAGVNSIGLLDFQDALIGSPAYDLVSLLEDARIDVPHDFAMTMLDFYLELNQELDQESFMLSYHILGAQRNSRILGVFARKAMRDNQNSYLHFIPRVLNYLNYDLTHPTLHRLKEWQRKYINIQ